ncbi:trypco2 family protein [Kitasatospora sp. NPDC058965]|uniref:trypco2 family protein n=1 Tax=Kitasatospora sp. NPDC058965 TaxID=3346682 RepID=UPI0036C833AC
MTVEREGAPMIELAEVIAQLRRQLEAAMAQADAADSELQLELGPVTLEAAVVVERSGSAGGKLKFWLAELGMDGKIDHSATQRITLTLQPKLKSGGSPWVSGDEHQNER